MLLSFLLVPSIIFAEDIYVAQNTTGIDVGSSCANAHSSSWFNTAANWGAGDGKISGGDTAHLCGTLTSTMVAQANGSVGLPITIKFEVGARISQPVCSNITACLNISNRTYIIVDGGTSGIVESTANGTSPTYAYQLGSLGIYAKPCSNCEIKNLTIRNMYVHTSLEDRVVNYTTVNAIKFSGSNIRIHHNTIHDIGWALFQQYGVSETAVEIDHNNIYRSSHGWTAAGVQTNAALTNVKFHDNHIHDFDNWDTTPIDKQSPYHHDGIHLFGTVALNDRGDQYDIYNNLFDGNCGATMTAHIFMEAGASRWSDTGSSRIFNNVFICNSVNVVYGLVQVGSGHAEVYNNTIIGPGLDDGICLGAYNSINTVIKNNTISGCMLLVALAETVSFANTATDFNYNVYGQCGSLNCFHWTIVSPFTFAFSTWKTNCGCDGNSTHNASLMLDSAGRPMAGSPTIGAGTNLSSLLISDLNRDKVLIARPSIGAWTVGAYNFASNAVFPTAPTKLTIK